MAPRKFRWSIDNGSTWTEEEEELPFNLASVTSEDEVIVQAIGPNVYPRIQISGTPDEAVVGESYDWSPTVTDGFGTRIFSISPALPAGLSLNTSTGAITGEPEEAGEYEGALTVTDDTGTASLPITLTTGVVPYTRAQDYVIGNVGGLRWPNKAVGLSGTSPTTKTKLGQTLTRLSPPWVVPAGTDLLMAFPDIRLSESGTEVNEIACPADFTIEAASVKYLDGGGVSRVSAATFPDGGLMSTTSTTGGKLAVCTLAHDLPANTPMTIAFALSFAAGSQLIGGYDPIAGETSRAHDTTSFATAVNAGAALTTVSGSASCTIGGFYYGPAFIAAKGSDGRPAFYLDGDSIAFGKGTPGDIAPNGVAGIVEVGLARTTGGYAVPVCNAAIAASRPSTADPSAGAAYNPNVADKHRALVDQVTALNNGRPPFSHYICEHGTNSLGTPYDTLPAFVAMMKTRHAWLKAWHDLPLVQTTMIQKNTSSDGFRTVANQTPQGIDATGGVRFQFNDKLLSDLLDGTVDFAVNTYAPIAADTGLNRDKFAVAPFTATTTRDNVSSASNIYLNAAPPIGSALCLDPLSGSGQSRIAVAVTTITPDVEYQVLTTVGSSSGTYPAKTTGTLVGAHLTADGVPSSSGLHVTRVANEMIAPAYDTLKAALKTAVSGSWN